MLFFFFNLEVNLKQIMADNIKHRAQIGLPQASPNIRQLNGKKLFYSNENLSKFTNEIKEINNSNNKIEIITPLLFQPYHSSIDSWMATLIQESEKNLKQSSSVSSKNSQDRNKNMKMDSQNKSNNINNNNINNNVINIRQEELYRMLSDPINGPSINKLMDQLSKSWSIIENNANNNNIISNNNNVLELNSSNHHLNIKNNRKFISKKAFDNISTSSNGSKKTTTTLSSLAENHIYEEILYEMFNSTAATNI